MFFLPLHRRINDRFPAAVAGLVAVNVAAFLTFFWAARSVDDLEPLWRRWGYVPADPELSALVTHLFIHAGWEHLAGNLLMLALMGMNVERRLGPAAFLALYFSSGFAAAGLFALFNPGLEVPLGGASGAISGVAGAYLACFAKREVDVFWFLLVNAGTLRLPAWTFTIFWAAMEIVQAVLLNGQTNVANWAHVGGFAAGLGGALLLRLLGHRGVPENAEPATGLRRRVDPFRDLAYVPLAPEAAYVAVARRFAAPPDARPSALGPPLPYAAARELLARMEADGHPAFLVERRHAAELPPLLRARRAEVDGAVLALEDDLGRVHRRDLELLYLATASLDERGEPTADLLMTSPWTCFRLRGEPARSAARALADRAPASPEFRELAATGAISAGPAPLPLHDERTAWLLRVKASGILKAEDAT